MARASNFKLQSSMKMRRSQRSVKLCGSATRLMSRKGINYFQFAHASADSVVCGFTALLRVEARPSISL